MGAGTDETVPQGWRYTARSWVYRLTGFDLARPRTLVAAVLPGQILEESAIEHFPGRQVATEESAPAGASAAESDTANPAEPTTGQAPPAMLAGLRARNWGDKPLVLIYHTHSSERDDGAQAASTGKAVFHNYNTKETGVIRVGEQLADSLSARYNIPVIHSTAIHDFPSFPQAYNNSAKTVKNILKSYPSIQVVLDLHRDGVENVSYIKEVERRAVSQVVIIATKPGTYQAALHPNWWQNVHFAEEMAAKMGEIHPGLLRRSPLIVSSARYNQNLHSNMVLLEVGNYLDEEEAALHSADMREDVVAAMLAEVTAPGLQASPPNRQQRAVRHQDQKHKLNLSKTCNLAAAGGDTAAKPPATGESDDRGARCRQKSGGGHGYPP